MPKPRSMESRRGWSSASGCSTCWTRTAAIRSARRVGRRSPSRGRPRKVVRHVIQAAAASTVRSAPGRPCSGRKWPCWSRNGGAEDGPVVVVSPAGPLTRSELELVQAVGDPLALTRPVAGRAGGGRAALAGGRGRRGGAERLRRDRGQRAGRHARVGRRAPRRGSGSAAGSRARCTAAQGRSPATALVTFDRRMGWIDRLEINRNESRRPGPIEAGLDVKSTLTMTRHADQPPATLADAALARLPAGGHAPQRACCSSMAPDGKATVAPRPELARLLGRPRS